jgi:hypothetical protein
VSAHLIFPICHNDMPHLEKNILWQRAANLLCTPSSLLESVILAEFQATASYYSLDLTKEKYSISTPSMVEKENVIVGINPKNFIACEKIKSA